MMLVGKVPEQSGLEGKKGLSVEHTYLRREKKSGEAPATVWVYASKSGRHDLRLPSLVWESSTYFPFT